MSPSPPPRSPASPDLPLNHVSVQVRGLNYFFGKGDLRKQALFNINLDLHRGQIVIMTGPPVPAKPPC